MCMFRRLVPHALIRSVTTNGYPFSLLLGKGKHANHLRFVALLYTLPTPKTINITRLRLSPMDHQSKTIQISILSFPGTVEVENKRQWNMLIQPKKEWLEIGAIFFRDGVEKMMRNASYYVILFLVKRYLPTPKETSMSNPPTCTIESTNLSINLSCYAYKCTERRLSQWHPKVIPSGVRQVLSDQSLQPFWVSRFTISHFGSTQESSYS